MGQLPGYCFLMGEKDCLPPGVEVISVQGWVTKLSFGNLNGLFTSYEASVRGTKGTFPLAQNFRFAFSGIFPVLGLREQPREQPNFTQNLVKFLS